MPYDPFDERGLAPFDKLRLAQQQPQNYPQPRQTTTRAVKEAPGGFSVNPTLRRLEQQHYDQGQTALKEQATADKEAQKALKAQNRALNSEAITIENRALAALRDQERTAKTAARKAKGAIDSGKDNNEALNKLRRLSVEDKKKLASGIDITSENTGEEITAAEASPRLKEGGAGGKLADIQKLDIEAKRLEHEKEETLAATEASRRQWEESIRLRKDYNAKGIPWSERLMNAAKPEETPANPWQAQSPEGEAAPVSVPKATTAPPKNGRSTDPYAPGAPGLRERLDNMVPGSPEEKEYLQGTAATTATAEPDLDAMAADLERRGAELQAKAAPVEAARQKLLSTPVTATSPTPATLPDGTQVDFKAAKEYQTIAEANAGLEQEQAKYNADVEAFKAARTAAHEKQMAERKAAIDALPKPVRERVTALDDVHSIASKNAVATFGEGTPQAQAALAALDEAHKRMLPQAQAEAEQERQTFLEKSWQPIADPNGNELGRFRMSDDGETSIRLPQKDGSSVETKIKIAPPTDEDVAAETKKTADLIAQRQGVLAQAKMLDENALAGGFKRALEITGRAGTSVGLPDWAQKWVYGKVGLEAAAPNSVQDLEQEVASLMQRQQALQGNGKAVVMADRVTDALKKSDVKDKVGSGWLEGMGEDFTRGFYRWVAGNKVAWNDVTALAEQSVKGTALEGKAANFIIGQNNAGERDEWREHMRNLPKYEKGSTGAAFRGGGEGFVREAVEGFGGMTPQIVTALVAGAASRIGGKALQTQIATELQAGNALTTTSLGSMGVSAYGSAVEQILTQAGALREQAKAAATGGDTATAKSLNERADFIEKHHRELSVVQAGAEVASEFALKGLGVKEETLLIPGRARGMLKTILPGRAGALAEDLGGSFIEGVAAEVLQAPVNQVIGQPTTPGQVLEAGALEAAAGAPLVGMSSLFGGKQAAQTMDDIGKRAASDAEIAGNERYAVLRAIAQGTPVSALTSTQLNAIGLDRPQGSSKIVPLKPQKGQAPVTPDVHVDDKGRAVILQPALDAMEQDAPVTRSLVGLSAAERQAQIAAEDAAAQVSPSQPTASSAANAPSPAADAAGPLQDGTSGQAPAAASQAAGSAQGGVVDSRSATPSAQVSDEAIASETIASLSARTAPGVDRTQAMRERRQAAERIVSTLKKGDTLTTDDGVFEVASVIGGGKVFVNGAAEPLDAAMLIVPSQARDISGNTIDIAPAVITRKATPTAPTAQIVPRGTPNPDLWQLTDETGAVVATLPKKSIVSPKGAIAAFEKMTGGPVDPARIIPPGKAPAAPDAFAEKIAAAKAAAAPETAPSKPSKPAPAPLPEQTAELKTDQGRPLSKTKGGRNAAKQFSSHAQIRIARAEAAGDTEKANRLRKASAVIAKKLKGIGWLFEKVELQTGGRSASGYRPHDGTLIVDVDAMLDQVADAAAEGKSPEDLADSIFKEEFRHRVIMAKVDQSSPDYDPAFVQNIKEAWKNLTPEERKQFEVLYTKEIGVALPNVSVGELTQAEHEFAVRAWALAENEALPESLTAGIAERIRTYIRAVADYLGQLLERAKAETDADPAVVMALRSFLKTAREAEQRLVERMRAADAAKKAEAKADGGLQSNKEPTQAEPVAPVTPKVTAEKSNKKFRIGTGLPTAKKNPIAPDLIDFVSRGDRIRPTPLANKVLADGNAINFAQRRQLFGTAGSDTIDVVAQNAFESGLIASPTPEALRDALAEAWNTRAKTGSQTDAEAANTAEQEAQRIELEKATASGKKAVDTGNLQVGDFLDIEGERVEVIAVDEESGTVTLKDHTRFGKRQDIATGEVIWVEQAPKHALYDDGFGQEQGESITAQTPDGQAVTITPQGNQVLSSSRAYHGTPHKVDRFSTEKIGTGEGAQAYGHGLYFAQNPDVAKRYQEQLRPMTEVLDLTVGGVPLYRRGEPVNYSPYQFTQQPSERDYARASIQEDLLIYEWKLREAFDKEGVDGVVKMARDVINDRLEMARDENEKMVGPLERILARLDSGKENQVVFKKGEAHLYTVELLPDEDEYLDWDKPLIKQSKTVKESLKKAGVWKYLKGIESDFAAPSIARGREKRGHNIYAAVAHKTGSEKAASEYLHSIGIKGIRYLDGSSREQGAGTSNYVIFSEDDIRITHENGNPVAPAVLFSSPNRAPAQSEMFGEDMPFNLTAETAEDRRKREAKELDADNKRKAREAEDARKLADRQQGALFSSPAPSTRLAPNGQPSKLNERQWQHVRTPQFKAWFGDWEALAKRNAIDSANPVVINSSAPDDKAALRAWADSAYPRDAEFTNAATGRKVRMVNTGRKKLRSHSAETITLRLIPGLRQLIEQAIPIYEQQDQDGERRNWHHYAVKAIVDGQAVHIRLTTWQSKDGTEMLDLFHDAHATDSATLKRQDPELGSLRAMQDQVVPGLDKDKLLQWWNSVNPATVSKVVDENGEPLVVWHAGTVKDSFTVEYIGTGYGDAGYLGRGFYFHEDRDIVEGIYAQQGDVRPYFLNIRNPIDVAKRGASLAGLALDGTPFDGVREIVRDGGDVVPMGEWMAPTSTQIKSATANNGSYDNDDASTLSSSPSNPSDAAEPLDTGGSPSSLLQFTPRPLSDLSRDERLRQTALQSHLGDDPRTRELGITAVFYKADDLAGQREPRGGERDVGGSATLAAIRAFEEGTGRKVFFVGAKDGRPLPFSALAPRRFPDTIIVNKDAPRHLMALIGHEFGHTASTTNPALYEKFRREAFRQLGVRGALPMMRDRRAAGYSLESLPDEVANNLIGDVFLQPEFWKELKASNKTLWQDMWSAVIRWMDGLARKIRGSEFGTTETVKDIMAARRAVIDLMNGVNRAPSALPAYPAAGVDYSRDLQSAVEGASLGNGQADRIRRPAAQGSVSPDGDLRRDAIRSGVERTFASLGASVRWTTDDTQPVTRVGTEEGRVTLVARESWIEELAELPATDARNEINKRRAILVMETALNANAPAGNRESLAVRTWGELRQAYRESEEGKRIVAVALETLRGKPFQSPSQRGHALGQIVYDLNLRNPGPAKDFINHLLRMTMERMTTGPISEVWDGMFDDKPLWGGRVRDTLTEFAQKALDGGFGPELKALFEKAEQLIEASKPAMATAVPADAPAKPESPESTQSPGPPKGPRGATSPGHPTGPNPTATPGTQANPITPAPPATQSVPVNWHEDWARDFLANEKARLKETLDAIRSTKAGRVGLYRFVPDLAPIANTPLYKYQRELYLARVEHSEKVARASRILGRQVPASHAAILKKDAWRQGGRTITAWANPWMSFMDFEQATGEALSAPFIAAKKSWGALSETERYKRFMLAVMDVADRSRDAAVFAKNLVSRFGEWIREHAPKLWAAAKDSTGKAVMKLLEKIGAIKFAMPYEDTSQHARAHGIQFTGQPTAPPFEDAELAGTCVSEQQIESAFGSLDAFEKLIAEKGDEFTHNGVTVTYNHRTHEHFFWKEAGVLSASPTNPLQDDEAGEVIPLSQRFNPEKDSILYSSPSPSRARPMNKVVFTTPIKTPAGEIVSYEWQYKLEEAPDKQGEYGLRRFSDWDKAEKNAETGRDIVHQFSILKPDGSTQIVSLETALGQIPPTKAKAFKDVVKAARRLPVYQAELAALTDKHNARLQAEDEASSRGWMDAPKIELVEPDFTHLKERGAKEVLVGGRSITVLERDEISPDGTRPASARIEEKIKRQWAMESISAPALSYTEQTKMENLKRSIKRDRAVLAAANAKGGNPSILSASPSPSPTEPEVNYPYDQKYIKELEKVHDREDLKERHRIMQTKIRRFDYLTSPIEQEGLDPNKATEDERTFKFSGEKVGGWRGTLREAERDALLGDIIRDAAFFHGTGINQDFGKRMFDYMIKGRGIAALPPQNNLRAHLMRYFITHPDGNAFLRSMGIIDIRALERAWNAIGSQAGSTLQSLARALYNPFQDILDIARADGEKEMKKHGLDAPEVANKVAKEIEEEQKAQVENMTPEQWADIAESAMDMVDEMDAEGYWKRAINNIEDQELKRDLQAIDGYLQELDDLDRELREIDRELGEDVLSASRPAPEPSQVLSSSPERKNELRKRKEAILNRKKEVEKLLKPLASKSFGTIFESKEQAAAELQKKVRSLQPKRTKKQRTADAASLTFTEWVSGQSMEGIPDFAELIVSNINANGFSVGAFRDSLASKFTEADPVLIDAVAARVQQLMDDNEAGEQETPPPANFDARAKRMVAAAIAKDSSNSANVKKQDELAEAVKKRMTGKLSETAFANRMADMGIDKETAVALEKKVTEDTRRRNLAKAGRDAARDARRAARDAKREEGRKKRAIQRVLDRLTPKGAKPMPKERLGKFASILAAMAETGALDSETVLDAFRVAWDMDGLTKEAMNELLGKFQEIRAMKDGQVKETLMNEFMRMLNRVSPVSDLFGHLRSLQMGWALSGASTQVAQLSEVWRYLSPTGNPTEMLARATGAKSFIPSNLWAGLKIWGTGLKELARNMKMVPAGVSGLLDSKGYGIGAFPGEIASIKPHRQQVGWRGSDDLGEHKVKIGGKTFSGKFLNWGPWVASRPFQILRAMEGIMGNTDKNMSFHFLAAQHLMKSEGISFSKAWSKASALIYKEEDTAEWKRINSQVDDEVAKKLISPSAASQRRTELMQDVLDERWGDIIANSHREQAAMLNYKREPVTAAGNAIYQFLRNATNAKETDSRLKRFGKHIGAPMLLFPRFMVNALESAYFYTPAGWAFSAGIPTKKARHEMTEVQKHLADTFGSLDQWKRARYGKGASGTATVALAYLAKLAALAITSDDDEEDKTKEPLFWVTGDMADYGKKKMLESTGWWKPNTLYMGGLRISYAQIPSLTVALSALGNLLDRKKFPELYTTLNKDTGEYEYKTGEQFYKGLTAAVSAPLSRSTFRTLYDTGQAIINGDWRKIGKMLGQPVGSMAAGQTIAGVPLLRDVEKLLKKQEPPRASTTFSEAFLSGIPFAWLSGQTGAPMLTPQGEPVSHYPWLSLMSNPQAVGPVQKQAGRILLDLGVTRDGPEDRYLGSDVFELSMPSPKGGTPEKRWVNSKERADIMLEIGLEFSQSIVKNEREIRKLNETKGRKSASAKVSDLASDAKKKVLQRHRNAGVKSPAPPPKTSAATKPDVIIPKLAIKTTAVSVKPGDWKARLSLAMA